MNDLVHKFKRYEDPSLTYAGMDRHGLENIGLYDMVLKNEEYHRAFESGLSQA